METLDQTTSTILVQFDSDYDGVEVFTPYSGCVSLNGAYLASIDIWTSGDWELAEGELTNSQTLEVDTQVKAFVSQFQP